jgi:nicotinate-nucleotide adenylyltransferase
VPSRWESTRGAGSTAPPARRVGLLGGSFNPAHDGHRHISLEALKRLRLDEVWWMVSPQNPLKGTEDMAPFAERLASARAASKHPRIRITDIERRLGSVYTVDTLRLLVPRFPDCRFVWLMGADNLLQISSWKGWRKIFQTMPIAVFARPPYSFRALAGDAARAFHRARRPEARAVSLAGLRPPAWIFLHTRPHTGSATRIRARRGGRGGIVADTEVGRTKA